MFKAVLVSDFDGTMTANDFYKLVAANLLPQDALTPWQEYRAGRLTHFEALRIIFGRINASQELVEDLARRMEPDPDLRQAVEALRGHGWQIVVASAGCDWYIRQVLAQVGVQLEVHANPGSYLPGGPLHMEAPQDSPFYCQETGVDKAAIVRFHLERSGTVAFAGDGYADLPAALLVQPELRYAKADLAEALGAAGETFRPFERWSDVATGLLAQEELQ